MDAITKMLYTYDNAMLVVPQALCIMKVMEVAQELSARKQHMCVSIPCHSSPNDPNSLQVYDNVTGGMLLSQLI